jgi:hypothetical protein
VAHLLTLFHATTGMLQKVIVSPLRTHDLRHASQMHPELTPGDVLVGDRGFCSFAHLAQLVAAGFHGVMRIHQRMIVDFRIGRMHIPPSSLFPKLKGAKGLPRSRWVKWLGRCDHIVEWYKPQQQPKWLDQEAYATLPTSLLVRELRFRITRPGFRVHEVTLVTTLLDPRLYPAEELAQLYFDRWRVEVNLRHLKQTMCLDVLRCRTEAGVRKEICMLALVYNLVRLVMLQAARQQEVEPDRISFIDALRWLTTTKSGEDVPLLIVNKCRNRVEPRVRKRRPKEFPLMKRPRAELRQALLAQ